MYQIVRNVRKSKKEVGGVVGRRMATLRTAPPTLMERNWKKGGKLQPREPTGGAAVVDKYK